MVPIGDREKRQCLRMKRLLEQLLNTSIVFTLYGYTTDSGISVWGQGYVVKYLWWDN